MSDSNCLFCRIISGDIPGEFVHTDDRCVVIRDIKPQAPTHLLVIPRAHIESLDKAASADEATLGHLLLVAAKAARDAGLAAGGYRTVINTGAGAGQTVFHIHVHVLGGRSLTWPPG